MRRAAITFFGCGESPVASGTVGSAGALLVAGLWYAVVMLWIPETARWAAWNGALGVGTLLAFRPAEAAAICHELLIPWMTEQS